jgi:phage terminase large subunit
VRRLEELPRPALPALGLATPKWHTDTAIKLWGGPGQPLYDMRVLGNFPSQAENAIVPMVLLEQGVARWPSTQPEETDELEIGVDVARGGDDESVLAPRRGRKVFELEAVAIDRAAGALPPGPQVGEAIVRMARRLRKPTDRLRPRVKIDSIGVGTAVVDYLVLHHKGELEIVAVNSASAADAWLVLAPGTGVSPRKTAADEYRNLRTQLAFGVTLWLREGGALPDDDKLGQELVAATFYFRENGKIAAEDKDEVKKRIRRSPDRADAVALAIYSPPRRRPGVKPPAVHTMDLDQMPGLG